MVVEATTQVKETVGAVLRSNGNDKSLLVSILQDIQEKYNYLPEPALHEVSRGLDIPLSQVFSVATFFKSFNLKPRGEHIIHVCMGTACHVRGGERVLDTMERELKVKAGQNTKDLKFTLETVNCVGACALGPIVVTDGEYDGEMSVDKVKPLIERYK